MNIVDRIDSLVKTHDVHSIKALEKELGFGNGTIGKWRKQSPSCDKVKAVADFLQTSIDYLVSGCVRDTVMTDDIKQLIDDYCDTSQTAKKLIRNQAHILAEYTRNRLANEEQPKAIYIPLYDSVVSAGTGLDIDYTTSEEIEVNEDTEGADFAVRVSGDSMEPRFYSGDIVLVESTPSVEVGEIGIFILNGQAFIKELGRGELISLNSRYDPLRIKEDDSIYCQGRVIKVLNMKKGA